jgi:hypothetical protein
MKTKLKILAFLLAILTIGQIGFKALADSEPANIEYVQQQAIELLQYKSEVEAQGLNLTNDEMATLEFYLHTLNKQISKQNHKSLEFGGDKPGV